jgi:acyl carrier protein
VTARDAVLDAIEEVTGERPTDAVPLAELVDSLGRVDLAEAIAERLGVTFAMDAEFAWVTVGDVVTAAEMAVGEQS